MAARADRDLHRATSVLLPMGELQGLFVDVVALGLLCDVVVEVHFLEQGTRRNELLEDVRVVSKEVEEGRHGGFTSAGGNAPRWCAAEELRSDARSAPQTVSCSISSRPASKLYTSPSKHLIHTHVQFTVCIRFKHGCRACVKFQTES